MPYIRSDDSTSEAPSSGTASVGARYSPSPTLASNASALLLRFLRFCGESLLILLAASILSAVLFRAAPGADVDLLEANPRLSEATKAALREKRSSVHALAGTSLAYYQKILEGDFGTSETSGRPVSQLLRERIASTASLVFVGSTLSLFLSMALAAWVTAIHSTRGDWAIASASSVLLAVPSGVVALLSVAFRIPVELAVVAIVVPRLYAYCSRLMKELYASDYVLAALCQGVRPARMFAFLILPATLPEFCGMYSLSMVTALGVSIALEVFGTRPGIGELAWQAALNRDMPVVLAVTIVIVLLVRLGTNLANACFALGQKHLNEEMADQILDASRGSMPVRA